MIEAIHYNNLDSQVSVKETTLCKVEPLTLENGDQISLGKLVALAKKAGEKIMEIYNSGFEVEWKSDQSPLTSADNASNEIICQALTKMHPTIKIISEESKQLPYTERKDEKYVWLVDPLDGTKEFIKKTGEFTVNIGLCENGVPILGVVNIPAQNVTYFAASKKGAFKIDHKNNQVTPLHISSFSSAQTGLRLVVSLSHNSKETEDFVSKFNCPSCISAGSSLKLLMVSEGAADIYPRLAPTMEWDTCAAHAIVLEAGGYCVDANTKLSLSYNKENLKNPHFVCYGNWKEGLA